jgi:multiple sugar transport system substrate-binding protein
MRIKRRFLVLVLLLGASLLVFAGGGGEEEPEEPQYVEPYARPDPLATLPESELDGYELRISGWWDGTPQPTSAQGEATLARWNAVMDSYDVEMKWVTVGTAETVERLTASVLAGDPFADIVHIEANSAIPSLAVAGIVLPLDTYFDFDDQRWPENLEEVGGFNDRVYGFLQKADSTHGVWYNKSLLNREGLPDPYELQEAGEWTWDAYLDIAQRATRDTDGDGEVDQWGITVGYEFWDNFIYSNGAQVVTEVADGYAFTLDDPAAVDALDFGASLLAQGLVSDKSQGAFEAGVAALYGGEAWMGASFIQNMTDEVGFVFYPKGPAHDEYTSVTTNTVVQVLPASLKYPPDRLAAIVLDLYDWDNMQQERIEFLESAMGRRQDIETALQMMDRNQINKMWAFPGLDRAFARIINRIRDGSSAATAVEEYKLSAQQAIEALFEQYR